MFTFAELQQVARSDDFREAIDVVRQTLALFRLGHSITLASTIQTKLAYYSEAVLASAPTWAIDRLTHQEQRQVRILCKDAAEMEEALAKHVFQHQPQASAAHWRRSYLLYDLADLPAMAQICAQNAYWVTLLDQFAQRSGVFSTLQPEQVVRSLLNDVTPSPDRPFESVLNQLVLETGLNLQLGESRVDASTIQLITRAASFFSGDLSQTEVAALCNLFEKRSQSGALLSVPLETQPKLRRMEFPAELWPPQREAIRHGMLNEELESWGLAAPTGTGKTYMARLLIIRHLEDHDHQRVLYIVPSRALINEISNSLDQALRPIGVNVYALGAYLTSLQAEEQVNIENAHVIVATPERADMLLRMGVGLIDKVSLIIVDEAHHIEEGTRGALLELYLWRLKHLLQSHARVVQLSAVAPNIAQLTRWLSQHHDSLLVDWRSTRMRAGLFAREGSQGIIRYHDGTQVTLLDEISEDDEELFLDVVQTLAKVGPLLILCGSVRSTEELAERMANRLASERQPMANWAPAQRRVSENLDSYLDREMYPEILLKRYIRYGIVYHHAGLPHRVRQAIEDIIRDELVDFVFATTTLAEGVNFPFSTVLVRSLAVGRSTLTPRQLWNIAGRAGRPGEDIEGQCILFGPKLRLGGTRYDLADYLNPSITGIPPVTSALSSALQSLQRELDHGRIQIGELATLRLSQNRNVPQSTRGALNLLRVTVSHARASRNGRTNEEMWSSLYRDTFASGGKDAEWGETSQSVFKRQIDAVDAFLLGTQGLVNDALLAELGISLDVVGDLLNIVRNWEPWQAERISRIIMNGRADLDQAGYLLGPVSKVMADLEGRRLGGRFGFVAVEWLRGIPISLIKVRANYTSRLEDLVRDIYSRVQFLLPWGLYAVHRLVEQDFPRRGIYYDGGIDTLAWLTDAGVPSVSALRLSQVGFERVDATRLARAYEESGLKEDVLAWLREQLVDQLEAIIRGEDNRHLDLRFREMIYHLR